MSNHRALIDDKKLGTTVQPTCLMIVDMEPDPVSCSIRFLATLISEPAFVHILSPLGLRQANLIGKFGNNSDLKK